MAKSMTKSMTKMLAERIKDGIQRLMPRPAPGGPAGARGKYSTVWMRNTPCKCGSGLKYKKCCGK